jgi:hypothetical protein
MDNITDRIKKILPLYKFKNSNNDFIMNNKKIAIRHMIFHERCLMYIILSLRELGLWIW